MRLKNFDKYIKDKLSGYKPDYQEDIWKAIEEKLPTARVPNGQGSWLIVASAALVIVAMVPFLLKFNKLADDRQEMVQVKNESVVQVAPKLSLATPHADDPKTDNHVNLSLNGETSMIRPEKMPFNKNRNSGSSRYNTFTTLKKHNKPGKDDLVAESQHNKDAQYHEFNGIALTSKTNNAKNEASIDFISLALGLIDNNYDNRIKAGFNDMEVGRYEERGANLKTESWANWQSIFYPFWQNPAYAGSEGKVNITTDAKIDAVNNINNGNVTNIHTNLAVDANINFLGGVGIGVFNNNDPTAYSLQTTIGIALSKVLVHKGNTSIKIGAAFTSISNNYFYNSLSFPDQIVPGIGVVNATKEKNLASTTQAFGINGGIWVSHPHWMGGLDVVNANAPRLEHIAEAAPLPRLYRATVGYRFATGTELQWLPMVIVTRQSGANQFNTNLLAVYKNKWMLGAAYQNIDPTSGLGNISIYAGCDVNKQLRIFASHGLNAEWAALGINEQFTHIGLKYQFL